MIAAAAPGSHMRVVLSAALLCFGVPGGGAAGAAPVGPGTTDPTGTGTEPPVEASGDPPFEQEFALPVAADVLDWFRAPRSEWGPGNRGWEFATAGGEPVVAVGDGVVAFAGSVAGRGVVTIDHGGGLLSSVTGMSVVSVVANQRVSRGDPLGRSMVGLHLGFRFRGRYVDPALFYSTPAHAVLVPLGEPGS